MACLLRQARLKRAQSSRALALCRTKSAQQSVAHPLLRAGGRVHRRARGRLLTGTVGRVSSGPLRPLLRQRGRSFPASTRFVRLTLMNRRLVFLLTT